MPAKSIPSDIASTLAVKAIQKLNGSRGMYAQLEQRDGWQTAITPDLAPYIQYRGGSPGFLKVVDDHTLGFADFRSRQYITLGNLSENPKAFVFLMEYANSQRVKLWGTAKVIEGESALEERLGVPEYPGKVERAILFNIKAWDCNCQQHIHPRFSQRQLEPMIEQLQTRIAELEAEVAALKSRSSATTTH